MTDYNLSVLVILFFILLVAADKFTTVLNVKFFWKNYPDLAAKDKYEVEKNPLAKLFFKETGLIAGSILYGIISFATILIAYFILTYTFSHKTAMYSISIVYGLVIVNNIYFMLRVAKVIQ